MTFWIVGHGGEGGWVHWEEGGDEVFDKHALTMIIWYIFFEEEYNYEQTFQ